MNLDWRSVLLSKANLQENMQNLQVFLPDEKVVLSKMSESANEIEYQVVIKSERGTPT